MIDAVLKFHLDPLAQRRRRWRLWLALAACWGGAALIGGALLGLHHATGWWSPAVFPAFLFATAGAALLIWLRSRHWAPDYRELARRVEHDHPDLHALLLTAVEQQPDPQTGRMNVLQERVVREAIDAGLQHRWVETVARNQLAWAGAGHLFAFLLFLGVLVNLRLPAPPAAAALAARSVTVTPGDTTLERGSGLVIMARFEEFVPESATLVLTPENEPARRIPLARTLEDPIFGASINDVSADTTYHVEYAGERTPGYKITVFDYPALQRADARLTYPQFTGLEPRLIEDTRRVSAVEGTQLDYTFMLNKPVQSARLVPRAAAARSTRSRPAETEPEPPAPPAEVPLTVSADSPNVYHAGFTLRQSARYELLLVDDAGRSNKVSAEFFVDVTRNKTPELKFVFPKGDQRVSSLEEIAFQAEAWDDFGLRAFGLAFSTPGQEPQFLELGPAAGANEKRQFSHLLAMEDLGMQTDQLVSYFLWAEDIGPEGEPRRTFSDMYFAEVRPFEEIFREGQSPPGGGMSGQAGAQAEKLAELQKQIISATWKVQRRETDAKPSASYAKDVAVIRDSQAQAIEQTERLKERIDDPRLAGMVDLAAQEMETALKHLTQAVDQNNLKPLPAALNAEQAAYQALLRLQARVYQVSRMRNQQRGGGGGGQRAQRQLDQLELKQEDSRYETQRQAQQLQNPEQREQLQMLNRLRELAQRQQDINERIRELQTALKEARTEEERETLRRQLKRLQEQQQQMLADVDELRQRMAQAPNQADLAEAQRQLDQTRSDVRRAAEELEREQTAQALASGTRAQRELQEMREDFRRRTSGQFNEQMREMRAEARDLDQRQEQIGKQLEEMGQTKRRSLSDSADRRALAEQMDRQSSALTNLLSNARQVTEQAEATEPLLHKQLYDTLRKTDQARVEEKLDIGAELIRRGFLPQSTQVEQQARQNIQELRQGIERAAESVLGNEADALRQARRELEDLSRQVERELAQARPDLVQSGERPDREGRPGRGSREMDDPSQAGQSREGQPRQPGEGERGERGERSEQARARGEGQQMQEGEQPGSQQQRDGRGDREGQRQMAQAGQRGEQPGERGESGRGQQPGSQPGQSDPSAQSDQPGQQQASGQSGQPGQQGRQAGTQPGGQQAGTREAGSQTAQSASDSRQAQRGGPNRGGGGGGDQRSLAWDGLRTWINEGGGPGGPLTGEQYVQWSDRLRDIEEMLESPELRAEVARIREQAREIRLDFKRHSKEPAWEMVNLQILQPMRALHNTLSEELARRESPDSLVPIDRDPVPGKFTDLVRRYYEKLGTD